MGIFHKTSLMSLLILWIFITFAWDYDDINRTLGGFRLYRLTRVMVDGKLTVQRVLVQDSISSTARQVRVYIPDNVAYKSGYVLRAYGKTGDESGDSNEVGLRPRTPGEIQLVPGKPDPVLTK